MPGRRENESFRFDSDAFSALTVIAHAGRPNDDTGSLWHCDLPFRHAILPLSLPHPPTRRDASRATPRRIRNSEFRSSPARIRLRARDPYMRDIWRIARRAGVGARWWKRPGVDERGPGGRRVIFRRSSVRCADSTVINLTAMDTGLRDYPILIRLRARRMAHVPHVGACA